MDKDDTETTIAFLGTGIIGCGMIANLQKKGYSLRIYNRTFSRLKDIVTVRDIPCLTPDEAAKDADIIISTVFDDLASESVWFGKNGVVNTVKENAIALECSTLSVSYIDYWATKLKTYGVRPIDCTITGSKAGADSATLTLFLGSDLEDIKKIDIILNCISRQKFYVGPVGSGCRIKLIYNMLGGTILVAFAEALGLAQKLGLNLETVVDTLSQNTQGWSTPIASSMGYSMAKAEHENISCALRTIYKDLCYAIKSADDTGQPIPLSKNTLSILRQADEAGLGSLDMSAVSSLYLDL
jgi:3-hydroxyisobutyrate dehydrogenase